MAGSESVVLGTLQGTMTQNSSVDILSKDVHRLFYCGMSFSGFYLSKPTAINPYLGYHSLKCKFATRVMK